MLQEDVTEVREVRSNGVQLLFKTQNVGKGRARHGCTVGSIDAHTKRLIIVRACCVRDAYNAGGLSGFRLIINARKREHSGGRKKQF